MRKELELDRKTLVDEFEAKLSELYNVRSLALALLVCL